MDFPFVEQILEGFTQQSPPTLHLVIEFIELVQGDLSCSALVALPRAASEIPLRCRQRDTNPHMEDVTNLGFATKLQTLIEED